ncbi:SufE family protein [Pseudomonas sp. Marseille-QA0892]
MSLPAKAEQALQAFAAVSSWENRTRLLMAWGDQELETLPEDQRDDAHRVDGCDSAVWLETRIEDEQLFVRAASDARLIRGLLAVLVARVEGANRHTIAAIDIADWFEQLGLARQLSPSRASGMNAVWERIKTAALS